MPDKFILHIKILRKFKLEVNNIYSRARVYNKYDVGICDSFSVTTEYIYALIYANGIAYDRTTNGQT